MIDLPVTEILVGLSIVALVLAAGVVLDHYIHERYTPIVWIGGVIVALGGLVLAFGRKREAPATLPSVPFTPIDTKEAEEVLDELEAPVPDLDPNDPDDVARVADALLGGALHGGAKRTKGVSKRPFRLEGRGVLTGGLSHPAVEARGRGGDQGGESP